MVFCCLPGSRKRRNIHNLLSFASLSLSEPKLNSKIQPFAEMINVPRETKSSSGLWGGQKLLVGATWLWLSGWEK
jgi:hypothetical protein